ncbi:uncharacterized protein KY384_006858 [Bacidia gigantensis]|uniref:uncharacterized protein n=1 Tax=Bacidia gigantensis TaxID=2732470 RepID=UPI001D03654A|nr:uncharacterized protein KY384_006858 [Bacidia gigantensis]KAG8527942.1 hypothetical protein KY384_006858 [Bacidia gigantensis]
MPPYFPHAPYAEDQPLAKTLLAVHVLHRGFQVGAFFGPPINLLSRFYLSRRRPAVLANFPLLQSLVRTGLLAIGLVARMWGREEIEWKDRSWRLLENKGQQEVDNWSMIGAAAGVAGLGLARIGGASGLRGWKIWVGAGAVGNAVGAVSYIGYRHGLKGGVWEEGEMVA